MSRDNNISELDFGCDHDSSFCCFKCRPDICNPNTMTGMGFCYSPSAPNSANLSPLDDPRRLMHWDGVSQRNQYLISGANQGDPSATSTPSSGQGPSNPQVVIDQPGQSTPMGYPSPGAGGYQDYGSMYGGGYSGLAQSPASAWSGGQGYGDVSYASSQHDQQQEYYEGENGGGQEGKGKGKGKEKEKGKGKRKEKGKKHQ